MSTEESSILNVEHGKDNETKTMSVLPKNITRKTNKMPLNSTPTDVLFPFGEKVKISPALKDFLQGLNAYGDSGNSMDIKPEWLNLKKFKRGQAFLKKYFAGLFFSNLVTFLLAFGIPRILKVLIYTRNSETVNKAFKRFLSTSSNVKLWYEGNIWDASDPAYKSIRKVRTIHKYIANVVNSTEGKPIINNISVERHSQGEVKPDHASVITVIMDDADQNNVKPFIDLEHKEEDVEYISQFDLCLSQFILVGLMVVYPEKFGAPYATEEDLEGLVHFWRGCGYQLGIEDKYNMATNGYHGFKSLSLDIIEYVIKPHIQRGSADYEHISRMLVGGMSKVAPAFMINYDCLFLYVCWCIGLNVPTLYSKLTWRKRIYYWLLRFVFGVVFWIPGAIIPSNLILRAGVKIARRRFPYFVGFRSKIPGRKYNSIANTSQDNYNLS